MRKLIFIAFMVMSVCGYAQKYEVGTTTAVWKAPAAADFLHAKATGVKYVEVAFNQCYRGVPVDDSTYKGNESEDRQCGYRSLVYSSSFLPNAGYLSSG